LCEEVLLKLLSYTFNTYNMDRTGSSKNKLDLESLPAHTELHELDLLLGEEGKLLLVYHSFRCSSGEIEIA